MFNLLDELAESSRRQILLELRSGPRNVSELIGATGMKQPNVSNHLSRLRRKQVVTASRQGRHIYYCLAGPDVERIVNSLAETATVNVETVDLEDLAKSYADAATRGDEDQCAEILERAYRTHQSAIGIYQDLLARAMVYVGTWYASETITEAQEHLASEITLRMMTRTLAVLGHAPRHGKTALLGCAPDNWHVLGLRMIGDFLRLGGWKVLYLGANTPFDAFMTTVSEHSPDLVLVSCGSVEGRQPSIELVTRLRRARPRRGGYLIGVGGGQVNLAPSTFLHAGADFTSKDLREFVQDYLPPIERRVFHRARLSK